MTDVTSQESPDRDTAGPVPATAGQSQVPAKPPATLTGRIRRSFLASVGSIVFGMEDGTVSIFGLVFGVAVSAPDSRAVLLAGRRAQHDRPPSTPADGRRDHRHRHGRSVRRHFGRQAHLLTGSRSAWARYATCPPDAQAFVLLAAADVTGERNRLWLAADGEAAFDRRLG